ncbi:MAG: DUF1934 domain-containing protein [Clostridiales bacterium]|nr:DUF1934 domain-containing protein [Clostridiales bacterium]
MKNADNCTVKVITVQRTEDGTDTIEEMGMGTYREKENKKYILYKVKKEDTTDTVMISVGRNEVRIKRTGTAASVMEYKKGEATFFKYRLPYGTIPVRLDTIRIVDALEGLGGELRIFYTLTLNGMKLHNDTRVIIER